MMKLFAAIAVALAGAATCQAVVVYDYADDFSITNGNPNGVWSYGYKLKDPDGKPTGAFNLLTEPNIAAWRLEWNGGGDTIGGQTWKNLFDGCQYDIAEGKVSLSGLLYFTSTARWTAPSDGLVDLSIALGGSGSVRMLMIKGSVVEDGWWYSYTGTGLSMSAGDVIDVTAYGAWNGEGDTQTDITIRFTPAGDPAVPEPMTAVPFALGLLAMRRRHK